MTAHTHQFTNFKAVHHYWFVTEELIGLTSWHGITPQKARICSNTVGDVLGSSISFWLY